MNLYFGSAYKYTIIDPVEDIRTEMRAIAELRWSDFSSNLIGSVLDDGSFKLQPKNTFRIVSIFGKSRSVVITGNIKSEDGQTVIQAVVRPDYSLLAVFYFILLILLFNLFRFIVAEETESIFVVMVTGIILLGLILFIEVSKLFFRKNFERQLSLKYR